MSAEFAAGVAVICFVLMVGIVVGFAAVVVLDTAAAWPLKARKSPGAQYWVRSTQADTAAMPIAGWSR